MTKNNVVGNGLSLPELKTEKNALLSRLKVVDNLIKAIEEYEKYSPEEPILPLETNYDFSKLSSYEGAIKILEEKGMPMSTKDILGELIKRGKKIGAKNALTSIYSSLYKAKDGRVKKRDDGMWALSSW